MRFRGTCYRAHDPRWSFKPHSGDGAAIHGGRFNPRGVPALYLSLDLVTAVREANQGFAARLEPCVLCSYDVDCDDIVDLRTRDVREAAEVSFEDIACAWALLALERKPVPSQALAARLMGEGRAGIVVPSFAAGSAADSFNLVLWTWGPDLPHRVRVHDPSGRLPKSQLSWD
ncbi:MAG: RES family NAD+ phosphorylase [Sphingomonadales bacterium]